MPRRARSRSAAQRGIGRRSLEPGDLIIGDEDGLLCVPFEDAERLLAAAHQKQVIENKMVADIMAGTFDRSWVDATLTRLNCYIEE